MKKSIADAVFDAIEQVNQLLPEEDWVERSTEAVLMRVDGGTLDSLGLVNLVVTTEQKVQDYLEVRVSLLNEETFLLENSPFKTVGTLMAYIEKRIQEKEHG